MRLSLTPPAHPNAPTDGMFAANTRLQNTAGPTPSRPGGLARFVMGAQLPASSSCLFAGRPSPPTHSTAPGRTIQAHEPSEWAYTSSHTSMTMTAAAHIVSTTSTDAIFGTGANGPSANLVGEPPRHTRPLYSHIPLPDNHVEIHPALDYDADTEWHTLRSSSGARNHHWSAPATNPALGRLTIILSSTRQQMTVYPSPSPTNPYGGVVTVWDVLVAVEMAMSRLDMTDDACLRHLPAMSRSSAGQGMGRRCVCRGEIPSLEYLRQRYERAGLAKARRDDDVWILHVGRRR